MITRPGLTLRAWLWVIRVEWRRRRSNFGDLIGWLEAVPKGRRCTVPAAQVLEAVRRAYTLTPFQRTCLTESLAGIGLLRRLGHEARLAIGVKAPASPVDAHAWIEAAGEPVTPPAPEHKALRRPDRRAPGPDE